MLIGCLQLGLLSVDKTQVSLVHSAHFKLLLRNVWLTVHLTMKTTCGGRKLCGSVALSCCETGETVISKLLSI